MADPKNPSRNPGKKSQARPGGKGAGKGASRSRREGVRRTIGPKELSAWRRFIGAPHAIPSTLVALSFVVIATALVVYAQRTTALPAGRIANETRAVRVEFQTLDKQATERERERRRNRAPRVYNIDAELIDSLRNSCLTLPEVLAAAQSLEEVVPEVREAFRLTPDQFDAVRAQAVDGDATPRWRASVASLINTLRTMPLLTNEEYQLALAENKRLQLHLSDGEITTTSIDRALDIDKRGGDRVLAMAQGAGFEGLAAQAVAQRLLTIGSPTFVQDREATIALREAAARSVSPIYVTHRPGETITVRGERITEGQSKLAQQEAARYRETRPAWKSAVHVASIAMMIAIMTGAIAIYTSSSYPRIVRNPWRVFALCALMLIATGLCVWAEVRAPQFLWVSLAVSSSFVPMMVVVAYGPRFAIVVSTFVLSVIALATILPVLTLLAAGVGVFAAAWSLRDVRNRSDLVHAGLLTGGTLALSCLLSSVLGRPLVPGVWSEIVTDVIQAGVGGFFAGGFTLVILPSVERIFDITTGMSLSEWRDPKQPLLRLLQQRAPGTYNHSLAVATIAEAAADAIGADGLHLYVGALYHDIGKMNKPGYFVENQTGKSSKHENLSPAMSLLVIVGHVKDGLELAREYNLPRSLHHYIESHHGTTLVEYFYDAAKKQAAGDEKTEAPSEIEYRYPGPRPHTKEAAILMLSDAVESAARAMSEPTPARISTLVNEMAQKRLADGQFDESDLTLRELSVIKESVIKSLCAIYHARIAYPSESASAPETASRGESPTGKPRRDSAEQSA